MLKPITIIIALAFLCPCSPTAAAEDCEDNIYGSSGSILSPGYPFIPYENNLDCYYYVIAPTDTYVILEIVDMALELNVDYIEIYDGPTKDSDSLGRFTGTYTNFYVNATSNEVLVYFHTDYSNVAEGFYIYFSTEEIVKPECPADQYNEDRGEILSPEYPDVYPDYADCYYNISASSSVTLRVNQIDVEPGDQCDVDYVQIYDGATTDSTLLAKFCGSGPIHDIQSTSSEVLVYFHSNGNGQNNGFNITYSTDPCEGLKEYSGDFGTFSSPGYPLVEYPNDAWCNYKITTPLYSQVFLRVNYMDLEYGEPSCPDDYVIVYDGTSEDSDVLARWCGTGPFDDVQATTNEILVEFRTDYSITLSGFSITYTANYNL